MSAKTTVTHYVQALGRYSLGWFRWLAEVFSLLYGAIAVLAFVRSKGLRVVFDVGVTQVLFTGVHALPLVGVASLALGTLIITEVSSYPVDAATVSTDILVKDVVPLLVAFVILGRSGTAICVELASKMLSGELDAIRDMGMAIEHFVVLPRLIGGVIAGVALTIYGVTIGIAGGYTLSKAIGSLPFALEAMLRSVERGDAVFAVFKSALFGAAIVLVSVREGFSVKVSTREIPQATTRAVVYCMGLVIVLNTAISLFFG